MPELRLAEALLTRTFGGQRGGQSTPPSTLTPSQRRALEAVHACEALWRFDATMDDLLGNRGLPYSREKLRDYL